MNLIAAVRKANQKGLGIKRTHMVNVYLIPTNTDGYFLMMKGKEFLSIKWNPSIEDILARDWQLVGKKKA
ncbi:DUF2829 domain-containing protein [Latilactobacillus curvatus]|uniref:Thoeris anti-defense Tad2 family protein n=1 Tax=Latilactobacillus curvatus TaxID=28038 RepID=UPI0020740223|nr:MW1434 family type I TA system toxin [Latilactobacillus curvatus]MCM6845035.1 DUF2829 domain-containing protein [Latilactobacillus curvatus]MCM6862067.1 DUF2829 domain-containing protein [Latilactobacillus curvatus]MCM6869505.1 DUF2829 domain-containing protein [Latilactobacillus curvatus]MDG2983961.1 DUF2829 domain-containing protein [Latilactobacillus curvatus]